MELQITGTNIELTPAVRRYVERKLSKLGRHLPNIIESRVEISKEKTKSPQQHYLIRVTVNSSTGSAVFHGEERGEDPFKAVDSVVAIMTRQLERHKGKLYDKGRGSSLARGEFDETAGLAEAARKIVSTERFDVTSMSVEEAVEQMEDLERGFLLFLDAEAEELRLLFRRDDGNYGLIVPEIR
jgi:putative sigma-54 modulation protein